MNIYQLRAQAEREEIDYLFLKSALADLASPRDKVTHFLHSKALVRVKKGLYVFGPEVAQGPYHPEVLANLIYGPSAISLEYALSFYGMIPERVYTVTSITNKRNKHFSTPVGEFNYRYLHPQKYPVGITLVKLDEQYNIFMATPEKALADMLLFSSKNVLENKTQLEHYLFEDLRIETERISRLNPMLMAEIAVAYQHVNINLLAEYLKR